MDPLNREQIGASLRTLGLKAGDILFVHSSLSSIGYVDGGADTVVDAILGVLGPTGTLVVPTFTDFHKVATDSVFDPVGDPSDMGRISEAARTRPEALRSIHLKESMAAVGPHAEEITAVQGPSCWSGEGPFWKLYYLDARIMLLGVPYLRSTFFHVIEQHVQTPYRYFDDVEAQVREPDGTQRPLLTRTFRSKPGFPGNDFNKFGAILERRGLVSVGAVGNAMARLFSAKEAMEVGVEEYRDDPLLFVQIEESLTQLDEGVMIGEYNNEKTVLDPTNMVPSGSS